MSMRSDRYRFGDFLLDIRARELWHNGELVGLAVVAFDCLAYLVQHRDRPVGRDELIAAVWGRAEISESTLAHTVVRLRQVLGDNGNEQHSIRTLPRLGYRWVAPVDEDATLPLAVETDLSAPIIAHAPTQLVHTSPKRISLAFVAGAGLLVLGIAWVAARSRSEPELAPSSLQRPPSALQAAMVHPAKVEAPEKWIWLRLGLMDLVANRLRHGRLPTLPSELVLSLDNQSSRAQEAPKGVFLRVWPHAEFKRGRWLVRLEGLTQDGQHTEATAEANDVMEAAGLASDKLLAALGKTVPQGASNASPEIEHFLQQLAAARLAGHVPDALALLQKAPAEWTARPEVQLAAARVDCDRGAREACQTRLEALQTKVTWSNNAVLQAQVHVTLAWLHINRQQFDRAEGLLSQIIAKKGQLAASDVLGNAYSLRGWLHYANWRLSEASEDLGQARAIYLGTGNLRELARVDQRLGTVAERRGHLSSALASLNVAERQFENIGAQGDRMITLMALAGTHQQLLEFDKALAATDRYWSEEWTSNWGAALYRAWALTYNGRLREAETLLASAQAQSDPEEAPLMRAEAAALSARIALYRGEYAEAARLARRAASTELQESDRRDYLANALVLVQALQASGQSLEAGEEVRRLQTWVAAFDDDRLHAGAALARAEQAWTQGHRQEAFADFEVAWRYAERVGIPDILVSVGAAYGERLVEVGQFERAGAVSGRLSAWVEQDLRAARINARILQAMGNQSAVNAAFQSATRLAGERQIGGTPGSKGRMVVLSP